MRALLTCLLIACSSPALAMNWEGHDDWMADLAPALIYRDAVPHALTLPQPPVRCPVVGKDNAVNPYEQIPLSEPDCRASEEQQEVGR